MRRHAEIVCDGFVENGAAVPEPVLESAIRSQQHPNARGVNLAYTRFVLKA